MVTLKWRMRALGSCPAGFCPRGAEVVRRMASHNFRGSHDEIQTEIQVQSLDSTQWDGIRGQDLCVAGCRFGVKSDGLAMSALLPLYPRKPTFIARGGM